MWQASNPSGFNGSACRAFRSNPPSDRQTNQPTSPAASFEAAAGERSAKRQQQQQHPHHHHHYDVGRCVSDRKCSIRSGRAQRAEWEKEIEAATTIATLATFRKQIFPEPRFLVHSETSHCVFFKPRFLRRLEPSGLPQT